MKTWRVGSFSMGAALVFLGVFLLLTQVFHWNTATALVSWWPLILIILGVEILLSIYFSKQEKPIVKYDILSIFLIGFIGMCGIGLTIFSTTGILNKITTVMAAETRTFSLPKYTKEIDHHIKRIVLETQNQPVTIETTSQDAVSVFGTYEAEVVKKQPAIKTVEDYLMVEESGDTIYVKLKNGPNEHGPFSSGTNLSETMLIPSNIKLEIEGSYNPITLKVRELTDNWSVNGETAVNIQVMDEPNLLIQAHDATELSGNGWIEKKEKGNNEEGMLKSGTLKFGDGTYHIDIIKASSITVTHLP